MNDRKRRAIVTGGTGLIGSGLCRKLADAGWDVAAFDLDVEGHDGPARAIRCDVGDEPSVAGAFDALGWDTLDLLVNNAGIADAHSTPFAEMTLERWRQVTDSHLTGAFLMSKAALPLFADGASIVNMLSTRAFMSEADSEAYAASKGGLFGLTHALAISLGPKVRVNGVAPGWITDRTDLRDVDHAQHPVGRVGRPDDIADAVLYLADAGFVTGQIVSVDGGMTRKMIYEH